MNLAKMRSILLLVVTMTIMAASVNLAEAQLECEVPGECVGQLVGFVDEDDPTRYENKTKFCNYFVYFLYFQMPQQMLPHARLQLVHLVRRGVHLQPVRDLQLCQRRLLPHVRHGGGRLSHLRTGRDMRGDGNPL